MLVACRGLQNPENMDPLLKTLLWLVDVVDVDIEYRDAKGWTWYKHAHAHARVRCVFECIRVRTQRIGHVNRRV